MRRLGSSSLRYRTWLSLCAAGLVSLCSGPRTLVDPLGRPVPHPILVAPVEGGWIVIDSSAVGVRAVAELTRVLTNAARQGDGTVPLLYCSGRGSPLGPVRAHSEPVTCPTAPSRAACDRPSQQNSPCAYPNDGITHSCSQVVHVEYRLDAVPTVGDSLTLDLGDRISRSRWTRP